MRPKQGQLWRRSDAGQGVCERAVGLDLFINLRDHCLAICFWQLMLAYFPRPEGNSNWIMALPFYAVCCHANSVEQSRAVLRILWAATTGCEIHGAAGFAVLHPIGRTVVDGTPHSILTKRPADCQSPMPSLLGIINTVWLHPHRSSALALWRKLGCRRPKGDDNRWVVKYQNFQEDRRRNQQHSMVVD